LTSKRRKTFRNRLILSTFLIVTGLTAIGFLAANVIQELRNLNSARSDNVQWTLSQTEVEFLGLERVLLDARQTAQPDLRQLRQDFDIFFSRISTIRQSSLYSTLRELPEFATNLAQLATFLDQSAVTMDSADQTLIDALPILTRDAAHIRPAVRRLSNSGLTYFAQQSDQWRQNISQTLIRLAFCVTGLVITLLLLAIYLGHLNRLNIRRSNEALQASHRMNIVTGTALDAVIVANSDGSILDFNASAEHIFGSAARDAIGSKIGKFIVLSDPTEADEIGMKGIRNADKKHIVGKGRVKMEAKRASGEVFPVELAIQSADTPDGEIFVSFLRDISHRVAAEQALVHARDRALAGEKAKTDFLATMSHEIRTPLNGLLGNLKLLEDTQVDAKQQQFVRNMNTSGKLLMSHISDVLDITKYDAGKLQLRPVDMNISDLMQDIVDNQTGAATPKLTTVSWGWDGPPCDWIHADQERLQHVLLNIVGNAVKFTPRGSVCVRIKALDHADRTHLQFKVTDTGIGIHPDLQDEIFGDFMTGDSSYDRDVEGTGLGLGIAQRFITAMGGTIKVVSTPDVGSVFTVALPVIPIQPPVPSSPQRDSNTTTEPKHVLLVEDNEINRMVAREMLRAAGHRVTEAQNGQIAVKLAENQLFDLILMDISMPVMDGRTATRTIRAGTGRGSRTPIVALTANAVAEEQAAFLSDGMDAVMTKPLSRDGLVKLVAEIASPS